MQAGAQPGPLTSVSLAGLRDASWDSRAQTQRPFHCSESPEACSSHVLRQGASWAGHTGGSQVSIQTGTPQTPAP